MKKVFIYVCVCLLLVLSFSNLAFADDPDDNRTLPENTETTVNVEVLRLSPSDTSGLHAIILSLIGDYNPIVKDYTYTTTSYNGTTTTNHSIDIQPDWSWICCCAVFLVVVYCVFKIIGGFFSSR